MSGTPSENRPKSSIKAQEGTGSRVLIQAPQEKTFSESTTAIPLKRASEAVIPPKFNAILFNRINSSLHQPDDPNFTSGFGTTGFLSYRLSKRWQAIGLMGFAQQLTGEQRFRLRNTELRGLFRSVEFSKGNSISNGLNVVLPTNLDSRQLESLQAGVGLANRLNFDLTEHGIPGLSGFYDLNLNRNFHEFDTMVNGEWNTQYLLEHFVLAFYSFTEKWGVMLAGDFTHNFDYSGGVGNTWSFTQELGFSPSRSIQFGLGHTNGGDLLGANGRSMNVRLFNPNDSRFYLSLNFVL
ncbi:MAG: hypothetical protein K2X47_17260 [Bdellovibrionales bacterium]|nr:hypothetical protein [Bdellovibrionales bacterium]